MYQILSTPHVSGGAFVFPLSLIIGRYYKNIVGLYSFEIKTCKFCKS